MAMRWLQLAAIVLLASSAVATEAGKEGYYRGDDHYDGPPKHKEAPPAKSYDDYPHCPVCKKEGVCVTQSQLDWAQCETNSPSVHGFPLSDLVGHPYWNSIFYKSPIKCCDGHHRGDYGHGGYHHHSYYGGGYKAEIAALRANGHHPGFVSPYANQDYCDWTYTPFTLSIDLEDAPTYLSQIGKATGVCHFNSSCGGPTCAGTTVTIEGDVFATLAYSRKESWVPRGCRGNLREARNNDKAGDKAGDGASAERLYSRYLTAPWELAAYEAFSIASDVYLCVLYPECCEDTKKAGEVAPEYCPEKRAAWRHEQAPAGAEERLKTLPKGWKNAAKKGGAKLASEAETAYDHKPHMVNPAPHHHGPTEDHGPITKLYVGGAAVVSGTITSITGCKVGDHVQGGKVTFTPVAYLGGGFTGAEIDTAFNIFGDLPFVTGGQYSFDFDKEVAEDSKYDY